MLVLDPLGDRAVDAEPPLLVFLVVLEVALEPRGRAEDHGTAGKKVGSKCSGLSVCHRDDGSACWRLWLRRSQQSNSTEPQQ